MTQQKTVRNRRRIRSWMVRKGITGAAIAKALQVSNALVCSTISGQRNNRKVLNYLLSSGCPQKMLVLPLDMSPSEIREESLSATVAK